MKKTLKIILIVLLILIVLGAGLFYLGRVMRRNAQDKIIASAQRYTIATGDLSLTAVGSGKIVSADVKTLFPQNSIKEVKVKVGDAVKKGDVLATVTTATGTEENFTSDYAGVVTAVPGSSSATTAAAATGTGTTAAASLRQAASSSAASSQGFEVSNPDSLQMDIAATEQDVYKIKNGQPASIYIDALGLTVDGTVSRVSLSGDASGDFTTYDVTVTFNKQNTNIYLGMTGSAKITVETKKNVVKVPVDAVIEKNDKRYVLSSAWLSHIDRPQSDYYTEVKTGLSDADYVEVLNSIPEKQILVLSDTASSGGLGLMRQSGK